MTMHGAQGVASSNLVAPTNNLHAFLVSSVSAFYVHPETRPMMGFGDLLWTIGIFISGCLFTFGVARTSELEFTAARNCFWLAPIPIAISDIWWEMTTKQPLWARLVISGVLGAVLLIGLGDRSDG